MHEARGLEWVERTETFFGGGVFERKLRRLVELDELYQVLALRLEGELGMEGWLDRFQEARTGVVGCVPRIEKGVGVLEEGLRVWEGKMSGWREYVGKKGGLVGSGMLKKMVLQDEGKR